MIRHELLSEDGILIVTPIEALKESDFEDLTKEVDPFIEKQGSLTGLVIEAESFPGWDSFGALISHIRFVREHHQRIKKVAAVTDSGFLSILPIVAQHFVDAEVKHFAFSEKEAAMKWIREPVG